jgi:hypothetical protein
MRWLPFALTVGLAVALPLASTTSPAATGKTTVDATYEISIAGWGIARATLDLAIEGGRYQAALEMRPKGVAKIVTAVQTSVSAAGEVKRGDVLPTRYRVRAAEISRPVAVDMTLKSGNVTQLQASPPLKALRDRVPVTNADKRGIVDPLSSGLIPIRTADGRDACERTLGIFDGWTRYDVRLYYKRTTTVSTKGYSGPAAVCGARWVPVSGHRPNKKEVQYLAENKALEMWVVPIPGENVAIPYRVSIGTPNGEILIEPSALEISGTGV